MRKFNTSGPNILDEHYTLPRLDLIEKGKALVHTNRYFTIWAKLSYFKILFAFYTEGVSPASCFASSSNICVFIRSM